MLKNQFPEKFTWKKLGEIIIDYQAGFASGKKDEVDGVSQLRMNNIDHNCKLDLKIIRTVPKNLIKPKYLLQKGDLIFCNTNSSKLVGKSTLFNLDGDYVFSNHISRLRINPDIVLPEWVWYYLTYLWKDGYFAIRCKKWVNQAAIKKEILLDIRIPIISIPSQKKMINELEKSLIHYSNLKNSLEKINPSLEKLKLWVLSQAFEGKLTPKSHQEEITNDDYEKILEIRNKKIEEQLKILDKKTKKIPSVSIPMSDFVPDFPSRWKLVSLDTVAFHIANGATPSTSVKNNFDKNGIPLIKITNVLKNGKIILTEKQLKISKESHKKQKRSIIHTDDVLMNVVGPPLGKIGLVQQSMDNFNINQGLVLIRVIPSFHPKLLWYCLMSPFYQNLIHRIAKGDRQEMIRTSSIGKFPIPLIPQKEQEYLEKTMTQTMQEIEKIKDNIENSLNKIKDMDRTIMSYIFGTIK